MFLIISTDPFVSKVCATIASAYGYVAAVAEDHDQAMVRVHDVPPGGGLVLIDLAMRSEQGDATWERVLEVRPDVNYLLMGQPEDTLSNERIRDLPPDRVIGGSLTADLLLNHLARLYRSGVVSLGASSAQGASQHLAQRLSEIPSTIGRLEFLGAHWVPQAERYYDVSMLGYPAEEVHNAFAHLHSATFEHWLCLELKQQIFDYRRYLRTRPPGPPRAEFPKYLVPSHALLPQREHFLMEIVVIREACGDVDPSARRTRRNPQGRIRPRRDN